jgi:hypothetical protein
MRLPGEVISSTFLCIINKGYLILDGNANYVVIVPKYREKKLLGKC